MENTKKKGAKVYKTNFTQACDKIQVIYVILVLRTQNTAMNDHF